MSDTEKAVMAVGPESSSADAEKNTPKSDMDAAIEKDEEEEGGYLSGARLGLVVLGLCLAVLLIGLDNAILATAVPTITTRFNSLDDVGWYGSAFLISTCALQPLAGKIYHYFSIKWVYLCFLGIFELGSLICATAVSSVMLIIGRAVAGVGAAGIFSGGLVIIAYSIPLRQRPVYTGCISSMFGIANLFGPVLGGVFTQHLSWRWCFYINLPLGAITGVITLFFFRPSERSASKIPLGEKVKHMDFPGLVLFIPAVVMLLIAIQWASTKYPWKSPVVIGMLVGSGLLLLLFSAWQWHQQDEASIPPSIVRRRSVFSAIATSFFGFGSIQLVAYYLPLWFQVVKGATPVQSGVRLFPSVLANFIMSIIAGGLVTKFGLYNPWLIGGAACVAISGGIFATFKVDTRNSMIIGIQILAGAGFGTLIQMPIIAVMSIVPKKDVSSAMAIQVFFQFCGGALFLAFGENIFASRLVSSLHTFAPQVNAEAVVAAGAAGLRRVVASEDLKDVILAYDAAITGPFYLCAASAAVAFIFALGIEWANVKGEQRD